MRFSNLHSGTSIAAILSLIFAFSFAVSAQKFKFGTAKNVNGYQQVTAADIYSKDKGYGFETGAELSCANRAGVDPLRSGLCFSDRPFYFSARLAEGNYRVKVTSGDAENNTETAVKAELRRLMFGPAATKKGQFATRSFIVNVRRPEISTGGVVRLKDREKLLEAWAWDEKLTLEFNGKRPSINAIEIERVDVPTLFLMGDSTVCDQPGEPYASWGQMLTAFFDDRIAIANHAESGESFRSSFSAKRLDKVLSLIKTGDLVMIQFAHNDEKEKGDGVGAFTTFKASILQWTAAIKNKGGNPVLITPVHRRTFDSNGRITNSHGDYPEAVRKAAAETGTPLIDLTEFTKQLYEALGKDGSGAAFKPGDGTHHSNYGAFQIAKIIAAELRKQKSPLARFIDKSFKGFNPAKPDAPEKVIIPVSPNYQNTTPLGS
jgi:lysophospholipase L1-like esterase